MKRITLITAFLFLFVLITKAQQGQIKGLLTDSTATNPLADATVALLYGSDSSLAATVFTDKKGAFSIPGVAMGNYRVYITYLGYKPIFKSITVSPAKPVVDMGNVQLKGKGITLNEVEIVQEVPPVVVKIDTLEFNAGSFKTRENAVVEDLLKKLPGVTIDKDGVITAQGETVKRVLVDGKPFFGDDPKLATKNLPADIIDKIQLIDRKSDQAQFTGIDDGNTEKAINITIKKDKKHGVFGRASAGYGNDERYAVNGSLNSFRENSQLSFLGSGNNINNLGYTQQDVFNFSSNNSGGGNGGGSGRSGGGGRGASSSTINSLGGNNSTGITRNWNAGLNYNQDFGTKLKVNGSYLVSDTRVQNQTISAKQTFLGDSTYYYDQNSGSVANTTNNRINMRMEYQIDSLHSLVITPVFTYTDGTNYSGNDYQSLDINKVKTIEGSSINRSGASSPNFSTTALFRKKFNKVGRTVSANFSFGYNTTTRQNYYKTSDTHVGTDSTADFITGYDRLTNADNLGRNLGVSLTYTEPISKTRFLELTYAWNHNFSSSNNLTYDLNSVSDKYDKLNDSLSNIFENVFQTQQAGINIHTQKFKYDYTVGVNVQFSNLDNTNVSRSTHITQHTVNYYPSASFNYNFEQGRRFRIRYSGSTTQPTVQQLQPLPDLTSSLYVQQGNPDLKPTFTHSFNVGYNAFNRSTFRGFFANIRSSFSENKIVNANRTDTSGKQYTKPMNANGAYNIDGFMVNTIPVNKKNNSTINFNTSLSYGRDVSFSTTGTDFSSAVKTFNKTYSITQGLSFNYFYKELFDVSTTASAQYSAARYDIQPTANTNYFNYSFMVDFNVNLPAGFIIGSDLTYTLNAGRAAGYNVDVTMLNAFISKSVFKQKQGLIKLYGYDILKRNVSISRSTGENYIQDTNNMVLQQYFMLSFTYFLKKFGSGGNNNQRREGPPGMRGFPGMRGGGFPGGGMPPRG
ncbi:Outer membrane receptor proteins, mostly Fe transport [Chitinophaga sp. YR573]|uniref:TonB-dependent receptor n=1 Tax=Chitinophaga sp. YR573 TaxID=1881040 RepID=UPI0008B23AB2|nr:TonB-dependent receptor [Chitinophaga sp. YR573]SEW10829.1 Outer membrane receptor proteins, mostly Fe transport [Chitinophaga sp. YR573]